MSPQELQILDSHWPLGQVLGWDNYGQGAFQDRPYYSKGISMTKGPWVSTLFFTTYT